ncbi:MAG: cyclase family protein [Acidobacteriota bacterium]
MRKIALSLCAGALLCLAADSPSRHATKADVDRWMRELSNWNRWGQSDQMGTVNLISAAKRRQAAALVREGLPVSLAHNTDSQKAADNGSPFKLKMLTTGARAAGQFMVDDYEVTYHGLAHTHMDSLAHMSWNGQLYNGVPVTAVTDEGATRLAVTAFKTGIFTRGILVDVPRLKGLPWLEPGDAVYPEDLDAWEKKAHLKIGSGDVVFIRTGRWARRAAKGAWDPSSIAGLYASCAKWLKARDVAMVGSDAATDVMPSGVEGVVQPMHQLLLVAMGTPIFDNCDLETLGDEAAKRNRWAFLLTASPLAVTNGTGSPLNPMAVF